VKFIPKKYSQNLVKGTPEIKNILIWCLYASINLLFIYKYGLRQNLINIYFLLFTYSSILIFVYFLFNRDILIVKSKYFYFTICNLFFLSTIIINIYVDGNMLNVDRWSAMDVAIKALFDGEYPYTAIDHLNGRTSNLPSLLIIGIPFYLLGDVGYFQCFSFLLFSYTVFKVIKNNTDRIYSILLLIGSPSYLWELYVKSDLMSNIIIVLCFILLWNKRYSANIFYNPLLLGFLSAFLSLTRVIVFVPLTLFLFKQFYRESYSIKIKFMFSAISTLILVSFIAFINCPNIETLRVFNPLELQTRQSSVIIQIVSVILLVYFSFKIERISNIVNFSMLLILFPVLFTFLSTFISTGFNDIIYEHTFDLSYLGMVIPFIIYHITSNSKDILSTATKTSIL